VTKPTINITKKVMRYWLSSTENENLGVTKKKSKNPTLINAENIAALRPNEVAIKKVLSRKIMTMLARSTTPNRAVQIKLKIEATPIQIRPEKNG